MLKVGQCNREQYNKLLMNCAFIGLLYRQVHGLKLFP